MLTTPAKPGIYRSTWRLKAPDGRVFGPSLVAELRVISLPGKLRDNAEFVTDVTIPNGARLSSGARFIKTWKVRNIGTSTWGEGYALAFLGDSRMEGPEEVVIPLTKPSESAELSVEFKAPGSPGRHRSAWQLKSPTGERFGDILRVEILSLIHISEPTRPY